LRVWLNDITSRRPLYNLGCGNSGRHLSPDSCKKIVHLQYPNYSGTVSTGGGLVFLGLTDGTVAAFDDTTLEQLWKINVGSGFSAPPMTFEVGGKQYIAIASGPSASAKAKLVNTPELKDQRQATVLYVFGL
jgi:alcohol dehydrogenase (cytochrome c)